MDRISGERLTLSIVLALCVHLLCALLLSWIDLSPKLSPDRLPPVLLLDLPEKVEPPPNVEKGPELAEEPPEPSPETASELISNPAPEPVSEQALEPSPSKEPEPALSIPPVEKQERKALPSLEEELSSMPSLGAPPGERGEESPGSRLVYDEQSPSDRPGRDENNLQSSSESADPSLLSDDELSDKLAALEERPGGELLRSEVGETERRGEESDQQRRIADSREASVDINKLDLSTSRQNRSLLVSSLDGERIAEILRNSDLPQSLEIEVSFTLSAEGIPQLPQILRSSGSTDLDNVVKNAIRSWRFSSVSEDMDDKPRGIVYLEIRRR